MTRRDVVVTFGAFVLVVVVSYAAGFTQHGSKMRGMSRDALLRDLAQQARQEHVRTVGYHNGVSDLLQYINDPEVSTAFWPILDVIDECGIRLREGPPIPPSRVYRVPR